jgi:hypothetical protein
MLPFTFEKFCKFQKLREKIIREYEKPEHPY